MELINSLPTQDLQHVLNHTRDLWEELRGKRLFVSGATGFFGMWLLETFAYANDQFNLRAKLIGLSRNPQAFAEKVPRLANHPAISLHLGDVRNFLFPEGEFSHVIHAGTTSSHPVPPLEMIDTIVEGTKRVLDFSIACKAQRFLFVSSGAVYGKQSLNSGPIFETCRTAPVVRDPASSYGEGKRLAELLCALYHQEYGLETMIARCFAFVGPYLPLNTHFAIGNFIRDALSKKTIVIKSRGTSLRSYLYAADLAIWLWTILFKGKASQSYHVGSSQKISIKELAATVGNILGGEVLIDESALGEEISYYPDVSSTEKSLSLKQYISLEEAILKTAHWILKNN